MVHPRKALWLNWAERDAKNCRQKKTRSRRVFKKHQLCSCCFAMALLTLLFLTGNSGVSERVRSSLH